MDYQITQYCEEHNMVPEECVAEMRRIVAEETKLTASAGIAPNKVRFYVAQTMSIVRCNLSPSFRCSRR